jgi:prephenate dehydrogenase
MKKILIIGYGNFGKLLAKQLSAFFEVLVTDKNKIREIDKNDNIKVLSNKYIEKSSIMKLDVVVFAVPVQFLQEAVDEWKGVIPKSAIIMDVSSVKVFPLNILKKTFSANKIIGTHPLFGPESIAKKIANLKVVVSNISGSESDVQKVKAIIGKLKYGVIEMTPDEHDREIAKAQVLSHFIGFALRDFNLQKDLRLKTLAYRKMYGLYENVLNDSEELFTTIQSYNPYAEAMRKRLIIKLIELDKESCEIAEN